MRRNNLTREKQLRLYSSCFKVSRSEHIAMCSDSLMEKTGDIIACLSLSLGCNVWFLINTCCFPHWHDRHMSQNDQYHVPVCHFVTVVCKLHWLHVLFASWMLPQTNAKLFPTFVLCKCMRIQNLVWHDGGCSTSKEEAPVSNRVISANSLCCRFYGSYWWRSWWPVIQCI